MEKPEETCPEEKGTKLAKIPGMAGHPLRRRGTAGVRWQGQGGKCGCPEVEVGTGQRAFC